MAISVKKLDEKDNVLRFLVKGVSSGFINAVRRSVMLHVPCFAIEDVSIYENDSVLFDDLLVHRLGLLPIKTDGKSHKVGDKVKMVLEKEGPCTVYSKDIKSTDPKIEVVDKNIPITKLAKDQKLRLEMKAEMQAGKEHVKWLPAVVSYREIPSMDVSRACDGCEDCLKVCPPKALKMKGKKVVLDNPIDCSLCGACIDACSKDAIVLDFSGAGFIFAIEPIGGLSSKEIVERSLKELKAKAKEFEKLLQKVK